MWKKVNAIDLENVNLKPTVQFQKLSDDDRAKNKSGTLFAVTVSQRKTLTEFRALRTLLLTLFFCLRRFDHVSYYMKDLNTFQMETDCRMITKFKAMTFGKSQYLSEYFPG